MPDKEIEPVIVEDGHKKRSALFPFVMAMAMTTALQMAPNDSKEPFTDENGDRWFWSFSQNTYVKSACSKKGKK